MIKLCTLQSFNMSWMKCIFLIGTLVSQVLGAPAVAETANRACSGVNALSPKCKPVESSHTREVYYVGGHYEVQSSTGLQILVDQVYVEKLTPNNSSRQRYPLVFFHGGGFAGTVSLCRVFCPSATSPLTEDSSRPGCRHPTVDKESPLISYNGDIKYTS